MKRHRGRVVLVETLDDLDLRLAAGATSMRGWRLRELDLTAHSPVLRTVSVAGATFLGCTFAPGDAALVESAGALVLPTIPKVPVDVYRSTLYTPEELYDSPVYADSLDARAYAWSQQPASSDETLARALHDHAVDEALEAWALPRRVVGVMGGHAAERGSTGFTDAARLGHALGRAAGVTVATGGGPGAMEAANLGAYLADRPGEAVEEAVAQLAVVSSFRPSVQAWADAAFAVRERFTDGVVSLGIPTWHYGHEPPNVFAGAIAKLFRNSLREAILLQVCDAGIVFLPGAAGTVQEVFQDACENYYADESSVAPMVLVGRSYWTETYPAWQLLRSLARGGPMEPHVHLVDTADEAAEVVSGRRL